LTVPALRPAGARRRRRSNWRHTYPPPPIRLTVQAVVAW